MNKVECIGFIKCNIPLEVKTPAINSLFIAPPDIRYPLNLRLDLVDNNNSIICTREYEPNEVYLYNHTDFYKYMNNVILQRYEDSIHINKYTVPCINMTEVENMLDKLSINYDYIKTVVTAADVSMPYTEISGLINVIEVMRGSIFSIHRVFGKLLPLARKEKGVYSLFSYLSNIVKAQESCLKELLTYRKEDMNDERDSIGECKEGRD